MTTKAKSTKSTKAKAPKAEEQAPTGGTYYALMDDRAILDLSAASEIEVATKLDRPTLRAWRKQGGVVVRFDAGVPTLLGDPEDLLVDRGAWQ